MKKFGSKAMKIAAVGASALMALGGLAACGGDRDDGDPNKITFWFWGSPAEVKVYNQLIARYEDEHPGVTIAPTHYESNTYMSKFQAERKKPDVFFMPDTDFVAWADAGIMLDLNSYVTQSEVDSVWKLAFDEYRYDPSSKTIGSGHIYGFPKDLGPSVLTYNKTLLDQQITKNNLDKDEVYALLSPTTPMTWVQFRTLCKNLTADQNKESAEQIYGIPYYIMDTAIYSNNANYFTDDAKTQKIDERFIEAVAFNIQLATVDRVMPSASLSGASDAYTRFFNGKTIFTWMGPWDNADFWDYTNLVYDVIPVPYNGENPDAQSVTTTGSMCYGVSARSSKVDVAVDFAKWLSISTSCQTYSMGLGQQVPNLIDMATNAQTGYISDNWTTDGANKHPKNRSVFVDVIDGNSNSMNLYASASADKVSGKTRSLYFTYDSTWQDNLMSYIDDEGLWDEKSYDVIKEKLIAYRDDLQADLDLMNDRWKG